MVGSFLDLISGLVLCLSGFGFMDLWDFCLPVVSFRDISVSSYFINKYAI
jgi:hypothetical protein